MRYNTTIKGKGVMVLSTQLVACGLNYKTAPIALREQFSVADSHLGARLKEVVQIPAVSEVALLNTCNRTELYVATEDKIDLSACLGGVSDSAHWYTHYNEQAMGHMLRVASGLDSMALGEPHIFGQMKSAYHQAQKAGTLGNRLLQLFGHVFRATKRVRSESQIGVNPVSLSYAAINLAKSVYSDIQRCGVLLVGRSDMITEIAQYFHPDTALYLATRDPSGARHYAQSIHAQPIPIQSVPGTLPTVDIVITATKSALPIIGKGLVERALKARKYRPMVLIDLAVPRDVEPEVGQLSDAYLYNIDDLQTTIDASLLGRMDKAKIAERLIETEVEKYTALEKIKQANSTIRAYRAKMHSSAAQEAQRAEQLLSKGVPPERVIHHLSRRLVNKLIHHPTVQFRDASIHSEDGRVEMLQRLFELED